MPIELNDLILKRERTLIVPVTADGGESIAVRWNPSRMTRERFARLQEWQKDNDRNDPFEAADELICPLVTGWDITVEGKPYPVTPEHVAGLGLDLVVRIASALNQDYALAADAKKDSAAA